MNARVIGIYGKALSGKNEIANIFKVCYGFKQIAFADKIKELLIEYFNINSELLYERKTKTTRELMQALGEDVKQNIDLVKYGMELQGTEVFSRKDQRLQASNTHGKSGYPLWVEDIGTRFYGVSKEDICNPRKTSFMKILESIHTMWCYKYEEFADVSGGDSQFIWINYVHRVLQESITNEVFVVSDVRFKHEKKFIEDLGGKVIKIERTDKPKIEAGEDHISENDLVNETNWDFVIGNKTKKDWKLNLCQVIGNVVRLFYHLGFITDADRNKFKTDVITPHE